MVTNLALVTKVCFFYSSTHNRFKREWNFLGVTCISVYIFCRITSISAKVHVNSEWKGPRSGRGRERSCPREESEKRRKERRKKRDGRAKNRRRPGRKEGAENEGELRSASESPEASRSALSRWISSGQHRSLSFSLSPPSLSPSPPSLPPLSSLIPRPQLLNIRKEKAMHLKYSHFYL